MRMLSWPDPSEVPPWLLRLWEGCSRAGSPSEEEPRWRSVTVTKRDPVKVWCEYCEERTWTSAMKQQGVVWLWGIPSGKVYRCSISSTVDTHWACAVTYSSCSTHLLWLRGVPLLLSQGPCGSLCPSDLHWITLGNQWIKTLRWILIFLSEWLELQSVYLWTRWGSVPDCRVSLRVQSRTGRCLYRPPTATHCQLWETSGVSNPLH